MAGGSGKKGKKRPKNAQQSSQQNQDRPQTLPTESDFPTLGATPRGQIQDEFPALGVATRSPIHQAVAQTVEAQSQTAGKVPITIRAIGTGGGVPEYLL